MNKLHTSVGTANPNSMLHIMILNIWILSADISNRYEVLHAVYTVEFINNMTFTLLSFSVWTLKCKS
jgi:ABC-type transport system involved in Fe-S cluster assembly fused permease/ATPase subunit